VGSSLSVSKARLVQGRFVLSSIYRILKRAILAVRSRPQTGVVPPQIMPHNLMRGPESRTDRRCGARGAAGPRIALAG
jgi:hypothetical protein